MFSALLDLFKHRHKWETTHVNKWQHPTAQKCKCGMKRSLKTTGFGSCVWIQSDGQKSDEIMWGEQ